MFEIVRKEAAQPAMPKRFPGVRTPCWGAKRGTHNIFRSDLDWRLCPRWSRLPTVWNSDWATARLRNLSVRRSTVDGVKREWILSPKDVDPAPLPEAVINELLALPPAAQRHHKIDRHSRRAEKQGRKTSPLV